MGDQNNSMSMAVIETMIQEAYEKYVPVIVFI